VCVITKSAILIPAQFNISPHYSFMVQNQITVTCRPRPTSLVHNNTWPYSAVFAQKGFLGDPCLIRLQIVSDNLLCSLLQFFASWKHCWEPERGVTVRLVKFGHGCIQAKFTIIAQHTTLQLIEQGLTSPPTQYRLYGRRFYRSEDPTNSIKVLKEHTEYTINRKIQ